MHIEDRRATRRLDYTLAALLGLVFIFVGLGTPGFWEPWESGLVQVASYMDGRAGDPAVFWVPQNENHLVYKPLGQLWSLLAVHRLLGSPTEFALRLPGALLAFGLLLTVFATMRRFFGRGAAFGSALALVSMPIFAFGARLLAGGMWPIAGAAFPVLTFLLASAAEDRRSRNAWGAAFALSWAFALLAGGLLAFGQALVTLAIFGLWTRRARYARAFWSVGFGIAALVCIAVIALVVTKYQANVGLALEDRVPLSADRLAQEVRGGNVLSVGLRHGVIVGELAEQAVTNHGADRFVLSADGRERGTEPWRMWALRPAEMQALWGALEAKGLLVGGVLPASELEVPDTGVARATLQFFTFDLYDPAYLGRGEKATVRSIVAAAPGLAVVRDAPETTGAMLQRLVVPVMGAAETTPSPEPAAAPGAAATPPAAATAKALTVRIGQDVTVLGPAEVPGWTEVEISANQTGFLRDDALERHTPIEHARFDVWVRHLGFGLFPWVMLLPFALGTLLLGRVHGLGDDEEVVSDAGGLMLLWFSIAVLAVGIGATLFGQRAFAGVVPVAMASGALLGATRIWERVGSAPLHRKLIGFGAVCILAVLIHDYKESPWLFIETYLGAPEMDWEKKLQVLLTPFKIFRVIVTLLLVGYFFGAIGFGNRVFARLVTFARWRFSSVFQRLEGLRAPDVEWARRSPAQRLWFVLAAPWNLLGRHLAMLAWGAAQGLRRVRVALVLMTLGFAVLSVFIYLPAMSHHLTQKGLLTRYQELADEGEPLYSLQTQAEKVCRAYSECESGYACVRGKCRAEATSFYLGNIENIRENELQTLLSKDERAFSIIPRKNLARLNSRFRTQFEVGQRHNLAVLDVRSSRFLLVSNKLEDGEEDQNYLNDLILTEEPTPERRPRKPVRFTNGLEFIGYDLEPDEVASGDEMTVTYYFHVTRDITQDWQMFLHIDYPGNRINGDHYPGDGEFHTNTWLAGDYIKDVQKLTVDRGSSAGSYEMWFGFFSSGDNRLKVETGEQDGNDRVRMGLLHVTGGI